MSGAYFELCWTSVDGAGSSNRVLKLSEARTLADASQRSANTYEDCGYLNPWGYGYYVRDSHGRVVYRANRVCRRVDP